MKQLGYEVKRSDILAMRNAIIEMGSAYINAMENARSALDMVIDSANLKGQTADAIHNYVNEVYGTIEKAFIQAAIEFRDRIMVYENGFLEIDSADSMHISQDVLETVQKSVNLNRDYFIASVSDLVNVLGSVSQIYSTVIPSIEMASERYENACMIAETLYKNVGTYEQGHLDDCTNISSIFDNMLSIIDAQEKGTISVDSYTVRQIQELDAYKPLQNACDVSRQYSTTEQVLDAHKDIADKAKAEKYAKQKIKDKLFSAGRRSLGTVAVASMGVGAIPLVMGSFHKNEQLAWGTIDNTMSLGTVFDGAW